MNDPAGFKALMLVILLLSIGAIAIYIYVRSLNQRMNAKWMDHRVNVPAVLMQGKVEGWYSTRQDYFLKVRLDNGNLLTLSVDQTVLIPPPLTDKEKEIQKLEEELKSLKGTK